MLALAGYGAAHLASIAVDAGNSWPDRPPPTTIDAAPLTPRQQPLVSALSRLLHEDGVRDPARWAKAIVRACPTDDLGYLALVTAQIRRESHFLAPDLEWLYQRIVPELVHSLGVEPAIRTIGPMQVQRWRLHDHFERALQRSLQPADVERLALDVETGVAACVAVLDDLVVEYVPDRRLTGWVHARGPHGLPPPDATCVTAADFVARDERVRTFALVQKLLSDLTAEPLAIDGAPGPRTAELLDRHPRWRDHEVLRGDWQQRFRRPPPATLRPSITHDPRLAFVLADFHSGAGGCRLAALQALTNALCGSELACDGKWGPKTAAQMPRLLALVEPDDDRRADFLTLLETGSKRRWVREQLLAMARRQHRERTGTAAPDALVPDLWFENTATRIKGLGRISVAGYVAGSTAFYEDYLRRLCEYTGAEVPGLVESR